MSAIEAIGATLAGAVDAAPQLVPPMPAMPAAAVQGPGFADLLAGGLRGVEEKVAAANDLVRRFAVDDSVPLHRVTFALEEARLSVELAMQVRSRLVESYRELMNMQI